MDFHFHGYIGDSIFHFHGCMSDLENHSDKFSSNRFTGW